MMGISKTYSSVTNSLAILNADFKNPRNDSAGKKKSKQEALFRIGNSKPGTLQPEESAGQPSASHLPEGSEEADKPDR